MDCPFTHNVACRRGWIVLSHPMLHVGGDGLSFHTQCCMQEGMECPFTHNVACRRGWSVLSHTMLHVGGDGLSFHTQVLCICD